VVLSQVCLNRCGVNSSDELGRASTLLSIAKQFGPEQAL
jgi:hypothetical protein